MRAFIAIDLPKEIKDQLSKIQDGLKISLPKISWTKPQNLHLSLAFLGEISFEQLNEIKQIISETAEGIRSFKIKLENLGVFPDIRRARIVWIGTDQMPAELKQITGELKTKLNKLGLAQEKRPFQLHITLGRIRIQLNSSLLEKGLKEIKDPAFEFNAKGITLFESILQPNGPTYKAIQEVTFKIT